MIQCDHPIETRKPTIVIIQKESKYARSYIYHVPLTARYSIRKRKVEIYERLTWDVEPV